MFVLRPLEGNGIGMQTASGEARSERRAQGSSLVRQGEVSEVLGGIPWRHCRRLLERGGLEVLDDGKRRWLVRRAEWEHFLHRLRGREVAE